MRVYRSKAIQVQSSLLISALFIIIIIIFNALQPLFPPSPCSDLVFLFFYWMSSEKAMFCCHLVRTPWCLIQFKETARLLHATARRQTRDFLMFSCQSSSHLWCNFRWSFIMLLQIITLTPFSSSCGALNKWLKTRSDWVTRTHIHTRKNVDAVSGCFT